MTTADQWKLRAALAASLLVAGCGGEATTNQENGTSAATANAPATAAAASNDAAVATPQAAPEAGALTADFMVGKWSAFNGDCSKTVELKKDGTATTPMGTAKWTVSGNTVTFDYGDGSKPTPSVVKPIGADEIEFTHDSGAKEIEKRC